MAETFGMAEDEAENPWLAGFLPPHTAICPPSGGFFAPGPRGALAPSGRRVSIRTTAVLIGATDLARWRMFDLSPTPSAILSDTLDFDG